MPAHPKLILAGVVMLTMVASLIPGGMSDLRHRRVWLLRWLQRLFKASLPSKPDISVWPMRIAWFGTVLGAVLLLVLLPARTRVPEAILGFVLLLASVATMAIQGRTKMGNADRAGMLAPFPLALWAPLAVAPIGAFWGMVVGVLLSVPAQRQLRDEHNRVPMWALVALVAGCMGLGAFVALAV
jgi:hypothetical protein